MYFKTNSVENIHNNHLIRIDFVQTRMSEFEKMYKAIGQDYDNAYEKRKSSVHKFKDFPTEVLRDFIFKDQNSGSTSRIPDIPHLNLVGT